MTVRSVESDDVGYFVAGNNAIANRRAGQPDEKHGGLATRT